MSVVTLVRVLFENPRDGELMLALERKVTLHEAKNRRAGSVTFESLDENLMIREFSVVFLHR